MHVNMVTWVGGVYLFAFRGSVWPQRTRCIFPQPWRRVFWSSFQDVEPIFRRSNSVNFGSLKFFFFFFGSFSLFCSGNNKFPAEIIFFLFLFFYLFFLIFNFYFCIGKLCNVDYIELKHKDFVWFFLWNFQRLQNDGI